MARSIRIVMLALCLAAISGPSLIRNSRGDPTGFGVYLCDHLLKLRRHARC